ncbi:hypothetical protein ACIGO8_25490 [Streptomyces sp. NPDC053493]|uniref:hypothetical protein n=1 Tax=Streptomyces sp. NPDC053493 TaxID=3365705 RepID=UPI0037D74B30
MTSSTSRRSLLTAALAVPAAAAGTSVLAPTPAAAVGSDGSASPLLEVVRPWTDFTSLAHAQLKPLGGNAPQARVVKIAGTDFLQMRGGVTCDPGSEFDGGNTPETLDLIGTLPPELRPLTTTVRGVAPRNNRDGFSTCRIELARDGKVYVFGATDGNKISWIQLDGFSSIWR